MAAQEDDPSLVGGGERVADRLWRLQEVTSALAGAASEDEIASVLVDVLLPACGADGGVVAVTSAPAELQVLRIANYGAAYEGPDRLPFDAGLPITEAARSGRLVSVASARERLRRFPSSRHIPVVHQSLVAVPMLLGGDVVGVLGLTYAEERTLDEADEAFVLTVAQQCAVAIERCRLQTAERARLVVAQEETRLLETLQAAGAALAGELELQRVIQVVTDAATDLSGAEFGAFFYNVIDRDEAGGELNRYMLYTLSGVDPAAFAGFPMPRATAIFGPTFQGEPPVRLDDVLADPRYGRAAPYHGMPAGHLPVRSYLAVPVVSRSGVVHGGLFFGHREPGRFNERSERLVVGLAGHAAVAIDNAQLYEGEQRARSAAEQIADRLGRLQSLTSSLSGALTVEEVIGATTQEAARELGAPGRGVWLLDEDRAELGLAPNARFGGLENTFVVMPLSADVPVAEAARTRQPVFVESGAGRVEWTVEGALSRSESFVAIPLLADVRVIGVLAIGFAEPRRFTDADRRFFVAMGEQCAQALDRARLYESEQAARARAEEDRSRAQHLAKALQTSLLPPELPSIPGVELDARYHAALEGMDVGGDFYDVFDTGGDWALVLGDVVGKGPEAAALTALVRYTLRSLGMEMRQPARILRRLNESLLVQQTDERFCTVAYSRVVPTSNGVRLAVCLGGHLPPLVLRASGSVERIGAPGGLIGLFPDIRLWEETVQLGPGDAIVFFTDGVTEAARGMDEFGEEGVTEVLRRSVGMRAAEISQAIEESVLSFGGAEPRDDLAVLVLRVDS
jgi:GAF domain-containing protein